ncbi:MAG TPA: hypothetical protein VHE30_05350 [Polyangiaceae bacterium]|nr:hypothetical protein [Polyangiaceae bacterium]
MANAICIQCGSRKRAASHRCRNCGFQPGDDEALLRSVYLSIGRYEEPDAQERYAHELDEVGQQVRSGAPPEFDSTELNRLREQLRAVRSISWFAVLNTLLRIFFPAMLLLALLFGLVFALRHLE